VTPDFYQLLLSMHALRRLLSLLILAGVARAAAPGPERIRDVIYAKHDGVALTLDVVKPARPNGPSRKGRTAPFTVPEPDRAQVGD